MASPPVDPRMVRVAALAAHVAETRMAVVGVVEAGRLRIVGTHGLDEVVLPAVFPSQPGWSEEVLADLSHDERFANHPVLACGARFLASRPVHAPDGTAVGAVLVLDPEARDGLRRAQSEALADVAATVGDRLELRRVLARSVQAEADALASSAAKQRVTSRLSHDLRTPMTAILGFGQLLQLETLSENGTESVDHLLSAARKLLGMIDEVLDLNRIDQGEHEVALEVLSLADVLHVAQVASRGEAESRKAEVVIDPSCDDVQVRSDRRRLQQVVVSLVGNVLERSEAGAVIRVAATTTQDRARVTIAADRSGAASGSVAGDGTRDGLTLSKRLLEAMDGDVGMDATAGRSYWLDLPSPDEAAARGAVIAQAQPVVAATPAAVSAPAPVQAVDAGAEPIAGGRHTLLYVEDDPANQRLVARMFARNPEIDVLSALDGRTGLDLARDRGPGVVLLDLGLPDISGREVLATLKADAATAGIPVVVLSGEAEADRPGELERAGAAAYVTKPFNVRAMLDLVAGLLEGSA